MLTKNFVQAEIVAILLEWDSEVVAETATFLGYKALANAFIRTNNSHEDLEVIHDTCKHDHRAIVSAIREMITDKIEWDKLELQARVQLAFPALPVSVVRRMTRSECLLTLGMPLYKD